MFREDLAVSSNLTQSQYLMWMGQKLNPTLPLYNIVHTFAIEGEIDVLRFRRAFQALVDRSDALRTVIVETNGVPQQIVREEFAYTVEFIDFSEPAEVLPSQNAGRDAGATTADAFEGWLEERKVRILPLDRQLFDSVLIKLAPGHFVWYLCQHHLITDGLSEALVFERVSEYYVLAGEDRVEEAPPLPAYAKYLEYEREMRQTDDFAKDRTYWNEKLKSVGAGTDFYGRIISGNTGRTERVTCELGPARSAKLREIAMEDGFASLSMDLSLFAVFAALLLATLHRINGRRDLNLGTLFHGRPNAGFKSVIGLFLEAGLLQVQVEEGETFASLGEKIIAETFTAMRHIQPGISSAEMNQAFDVLLNFAHSNFSAFAGYPTKQEWIHVGYVDSIHSLRMHVTDYNNTGSYVVFFELNTAVFGASERRWLGDHFMRVVDALIADQTQSLGAFSLLSGADRQRLLVDFNATDALYPRDKTVVSLFEEQAALAPEKTAVVDRDVTITYAELNEQANRLAHYLQERGIGPEVSVAICMERSVELLVAIWGVLKAGGAYIPIDPRYPPERINYVFNDAEAALALIDGATVSAGWAQTKMPAVNLEDLDLSGYTASNPAPAAEPENLVYMIYTSGSTGKPKGTMIVHQGLMNYVWWARRIYQEGEVLDFPLYSSPAFDLTVTSIFVPLLSGGKIVVYRESEAAPGLEILSVFRDDAVDIVKLTPAHLGLLQEANFKSTRIRKLIVGGEDFKSELAKATHDRMGENVEIYNEYGPTEAVVGCMIHRYDRERDTAVSVSIGTPAANSRIYVLDPFDQPVPPGITGEMVISSDGVARGYHNRPELTAERFGADPFRPGARIYRSGDLARWTEDGRMVFLGRQDRQVKIRGARIELGEIEAALLKHPQVGSVAVDVTQLEPVQMQIDYCRRCGLPSNFPNIAFDREGICNDCRAFELYKEEVQRYFGTPDELSALLEGVKRVHEKRPYDSLVLFSGGKDSTYMLYRLVRDFGMNPLVFSLDNGYISQQALDNIRRICNDLQVDLELATTEHMKAIFADSLRRHSNVCDGCYKTIYTLSMNSARQHNIATIITGLARGQLFETRLADTFRERFFEPDKIDYWIKAARKAYHQIEDATTQLLDVQIFADERIFEEIEFLDFYRYIDVSLDEVYEYLQKQTVWKAPTDTGRSTNCLINDVGIYIHNKERGYHNYALPYSWDVRLGHKKRDRALYELNDDLDLDDVRRMLDEIGYDENEKQGQKSGQRLAAYFVAGAPLPAAELRDFLQQSLPDFMVPSTFIQLEALPLTTNGKVDRSALPDPEQHRQALETSYAPATSDREQTLVEIWMDIFRMAEIGIHDNFYDLGGDSIIAIQIVSRARQVGLYLQPRDIFEQQTIAELALVAEKSETSDAEQNLVSGSVPLTPVQSWFFAQNFAEPQHWNQSLWLDLAAGIDLEALKNAAQTLNGQHDALRLRLVRSGAGWQQALPETSVPAPFHVVDFSDYSAAEMERRMQETAVQFEAALDLEHGPLLQFAVFKRGPDLPRRLFITIHHLAVDGVSWRPLLEDLETAYNQIRQGRRVKLPQKSSSFKQWSEKLSTWAQTEAATSALSFWQKMAMEDTLFATGLDNTGLDDVRVITGELGIEETHALLQEIHAAYNTNINDALLTALALAFRIETAQDGVNLMLEGHGREEAVVDQVDLSRTVGWFTSHYPVSLQVSGGDPGQALKAVKEQLRAIPHSGLSYGALRYLLPESPLKSKPEPDIIFNYLGQFERYLTSTDFYSLVRPLQAGYSPRNRRTHALEINAFVQDERLIVQWTFRGRQIAPEKIEALAGRFITSLQALIDHCLAVKNPEYTRSDFDLVELDDDQFAHLAELLAGR